MDDAAGSPTISDVAVMRALAHPVRLTLLEHLSSTGPATATECADVVHLTPSATSYHLRALAKVGMVAAAPGRGDGRERFWRSTGAGYRIDGGPDAGPEVRGAERELIDSFLSWQDVRLREYLARLDSEPREWQEATWIMGHTLLVTAGEMTELGRAVSALLRPYLKRLRQNPPAGARTVSAVGRAFPVDAPLPD